MVVEVTYGKKVLAEMTEELLSWNLEVMELASSTFLKFYLVNVFHFCPSLHLLLSDWMLTTQQYVSSQAGSLEQAFGELPPGFLTSY